MSIINDDKKKTGKTGRQSVLKDNPEALAKLPKPPKLGAHSVHYSDAGRRCRTVDTAQQFDPADVTKANWAYS